MKLISKVSWVECNIVSESKLSVMPEWALLLPFIFIDLSSKQPPGKNDFLHIAVSHSGTTNVNAERRITPLPFLILLFLD